MDVFEGPYYRINKFLLTCLGQWPYQKTFQKRIIRTVLFIFSVSVIYPEILYMKASWGDMDAVIESASAFGVEVATGMKISNYIFNADKMKIIFNRIHEDWKVNMLGPQLAVLMKYADEGRQLTTFYTAYLYATLVAYLMFPLVPKFLDQFMDLNQTVPIIPFPIKYGDLDPNEYYIPMMIHSNCTALLLITTIVAMDSTYLVYVQHACGIFAAIGDRLEHLSDLSDYEELDELSAKKQEEATYREIISCVKLHSEAIEFADTLESTYVVIFFFVLGLSIFCMSLAGYQTLMNLDKPNEALRFATFTLAQVAHIFTLSYPGQKLIDHSERIHEWVYGSQWFKVSERCKRLLMIMMMRSIKPSNITAGGMYVMSFPNFSMVIQTSVSYFTVLTSFT
nr:olfactory receptor 33 [Gregopimpla kuwanae]